MRKQVEDLRTGGMASFQRFARPRGESFIARPPRFQSSARALNEFANGLVTGLTTLEMAEADAERAKGQQAAQEALAKAEAESESTALAFAKAVDNDEIHEAQNPYFRTGYARSVAQSLASRWQGQAEANMRKAFAETPLTAVAENGVAPQSPNPGDIVKTTLDEMWGAVNEANPEIVQNAWFQREFSRQRTQVESRLADLGLRMQEERLALDNAETKTVQLHDILISSFGSDAAPDAAKNVAEWTRSNLVLAGVKKPRAFFAQAVGRAFDSVLSSQGAQAAEAFIDRVGQVSLGTKSFAEGTEASTYQRLAIRAGQAVARERRQRLDDAQMINRERSEALTNSQPYRDLLQAGSSSEALSKLDGMKEALFAGTVEGIPADFADEAYEILLRGASLAGDRGSEKRKVELLEQLENGNVSQAEAALENLSLKDRFEAQETISKYRASVEREYDRDTRITKTVKGIYQALDGVEGAGAQEFAEDKFEEIEALRAQHRKMLMTATAEERPALIEKFTSALSISKDEIKKEIGARKNERQQKSREIYSSVLSGGNPTSQIRAMREAGDLGASEANKLERESNAIAQTLREATHGEQFRWGAGLMKALPELDSHLVVDLNEGKQATTIATVKPNRVVTEEGRAMIYAAERAVQEQVSAKLGEHTGEWGNNALEAMTRIDIQGAQLFQNAQRNAQRLLLTPGTTAEDLMRADLTAPTSDPWALSLPKARFELSTGDEAREPSRDQSGEPANDSESPEAPRPSGGKVFSTETPTTMEGAKAAPARPADAPRLGALDGLAANAAKTALEPDAITKMMSEYRRLNYAGANSASSPEGLTSSFAGLLAAGGIPGVDTRIADEQKPSLDGLQRAYPVAMADAISKQLGGGLMRRNPFINYVVGEGQAKAFEFRGIGGELAESIANGVHGWFAGGSDAAESRRQNYAHPYTLTFEVLDRHNRGVANAGEWEKYARENAYQIAQVAAQNPDITPADSIQVAIDAHGLLGIDYRDLLNGRIRGLGAPTNHAIGGFSAQDHGHMIPWPAMPLFESPEQMMEASDNEAEFQSLMDALGLSEDQEDAFLSAQVAALRRLKRA